MGITEDHAIKANGDRSIQEEGALFPQQFFCSSCPGQFCFLCFWSSTLVSPGIHQFSPQSCWFGVITYGNHEFLY